MQSNAEKTSKPQIFLYLLSFYIFTAFVWWSYLLFEKNNMLFKAQTELAAMHYSKTGNSIPFTDSQEFLNIQNKYERQRWMIIGEGFVFLSLLIFGSVQLFKTFKKEVLLARQQNNFLLSVTHEFRTPLASIKLSLQTFLKRVTLEDKFQKLLNNSLDDVARLQSLVDNMLFAARMENSTYALQKSSYNISDLLLQYLDKIKLTTGGSRVVINKIEPDLEYEVDEGAFFSAIINLIENALKYSPADKPVTVSLYRKGNHIDFEVKDEGTGITEQERSKIFDKFYRVGNEETRNTKGTGLGLFIVKKITEAHGGLVTVEPNQPHGSIFKIKLPLNKTVV